jgi:tRNA threonylcarbamoyladenosine biosynthesis protein TsaE
MTDRIQITTRSVGETQALARALGARMAAGMVVALTGDLGSGKTAFVQGLAEGLEVPKDYIITSPTFTLVNVYPGRVPLYHADLYRLAGAAVDLTALGLDEMVGGDGVLAIEWSERLPEGYLTDYLAVQLEFQHDDARRITLAGTGRESADLINTLAESQSPRQKASDIRSPK